jgi:flagellar biosynthetic protein FliR
MQPINIDASELTQWALRMWWPALRIGGFVMTAPLLSGPTVPARIKLVLTVGLVILIAPLAVQPPNLSIFSGDGAFAAIQEVLIGTAIGLVVQLAFEALTLAGQTISMTMGLGFATLVDPQHGAQTTVLGQMFMIFAMLVYLAVDGHLVLIGALADSFRSLPIGANHIGPQFFAAVASWGAQVFETGLLIALPAVVALIIVNAALGVITRAAPQLNLFGVGFPITMMAGFFVLIVGFDGIVSGMSVVVQSALAAAANLVAAPLPGTP